MTHLYDTLSALGYKRNNKPILQSTAAEFNHPAQLDDSSHLEKIHQAMTTHGYRHIPGAVLPTWVNSQNDDDAISLHHKIKGEGHRLFHMTDSTNEEVNEGFELMVQHPTGVGQLAKFAAKTHNDVRSALDKLRSQYPSHRIVVRNKHTGLTQIFKPHKVTESTTMTGKTLTQIFESKLEIINENWNALSKGAKELILHADNNRDLHNQSKVPILRNLSKKVQNGSYDHTKAAKLWSYHADRAAHSYSKAYGGVWHQNFSTAVRREAAKYWADHHREDLKSEA